MTTINPHTTRANGTILTAAIYNADHNNHIANANALNASKMEGATPPVVDGQAVVWNGTSGAALRTAGFFPVSGTTYAVDLAAINSALALKAPLANAALTGATTADAVTLNAAGGAEGGELTLKKPVSGSTLVGDVKVDVSANRVRFWDSGGTALGAFMDLTQLAAGAGSKILTDVDFSDQATAEAGTDNAHIMTSLRVAQAIVAQAQSINIGGATVAISSAGADMGFDDVKGGAIIAQATSAGAFEISLDGGSNYTILGASATTKAIIIFIRNSVVGYLRMDPVTPAFSINRVTPVAGAGGVFMRMTGGSGSALRIM